MVLSNRCKAFWCRFSSTSRRGLVWTQILEKSQQQQQLNTNLLALSILDQAVSYHWKALPKQQREGMSSLVHCQSGHFSVERKGGNESQHATAVEQTQRCSNSGMEGGVICILPPCLFCVFVCLKHPDCLGDYAHTHNTHVRLSSKNGRRIGQASSPDIVNSSRTSESLCVQTT